tara:strand:+ start:1616 stop:1768 length:153 start_codon:yes stop_codon:yes gene_type:complete
MIRKIKALIIGALNRWIPDSKKQELNNSGLRWDNEYSFHPARQNDQDTVE